MRTLQLVGTVGVFLFLFVLSSCSSLECNSNSKDNQEIEKGISGDTATLIAKGHLCLGYDLREHETVIVERTNEWEIRFPLKEPSRSIYGPVVIVNKETGEIVFVSHAK